jgi:hypothetical protein
MEDLPVSLLMQQEKARPRTGEELETFGKHAARSFLGGECKTLSEAVVETVKSAGLAPEQVKRVVEFANSSAYLQKFASEGPNHKVISFKGGPADFSDVIKDLNDGGSKTASVHSSSGLQDYATPPPNVEQLAARNMDRFGSVDTKLAEAFGVVEQEYPYEDPLRDVHDLRDKIAGLYDEATLELSTLENEYLTVSDELFQQVKQAALEGIPLGAVVKAMGEVTVDPELFKTAFAMLTPRLVQNQVFRNEAAMADSLAKYAGAGLVNPDHPLLTAFGEYCGTLQKLAATREVQTDAATQLDVLSTYMSKAASAAVAAAEKVRGVAGHIPKVWGAATDLAARASKPVSEFATTLGGETAGQIAGGIVEYSPHIAAGLAAEEGYQRAKNNPAIQAGKNFVAARVPYTHQNMMRQYALQQGVSY